MLTMSNDIDPWELPPLDFWAGRMLWKYLLILPFKVFFVLPFMAVVSTFYIVLLPYSLPFSRALHRLTFWAWRLFLSTHAHTHTHARTRARARTQHQHMTVRVM